MLEEFSLAIIIAERALCKSARVANIQGWTDVVNQVYKGLALDEGNRHVARHNKV